MVFNSVTRSDGKVRGPRIVVMSTRGTMARFR